MDFYEELNNDKEYQWLEKIRDWYRTNILFKWPGWMPGTKILAWRLDNKLYLMQQVIGHKIHSRRVSEYYSNKHTLYMMSHRFDRERPVMKHYAPWEIPVGLEVPNVMTIKDKHGDRK